MTTTRLIIRAITSLLRGRIAAAGMYWRTARANMGRPPF